MSELESIKALFNEKEKELVMAVSKVESLSQQLDSLNNSNAAVPNTNNAQPAIIIELEKLRNELKVSCVSPRARSSSLRCGMES